MSFTFVQTARVCRITLFLVLLGAQAAYGALLH